MPELLSQTGCFNVEDKTSPRGVFEYSINSPLWTDGAEKVRAMALPDDAVIEVLADGDYKFPTDTTLIKHFLNAGNYLETRLFVNHTGGWRGYSYEWNEAQTDATLLTTGKSKTVGAYTHVYPSQAQCNQCHTSAANKSLGIEHLQLNKQSDVLNGNVVRYLNSVGYFLTDESEFSDEKLFSLDDESATLEQRARSYLHSNCSGCHRPGSTYGDIDLRYNTSLANTNICGVAAAEGNLGVTGAERIKPGDAASSVMLLRLQTNESSIRMPPIGRLTEDIQATEILTEWINGLERCS
jgi:uncharacterized repeat protein (TIGR03806 family)